MCVFLKNVSYMVETLLIYKENVCICTVHLSHFYFKLKFNDFAILNCLRENLSPVYEIAHNNHITMNERRTLKLNESRVTGARSLLTFNLSVESCTLRGERQHQTMDIHEEDIIDFFMNCNKNNVVQP